LSETFHRRKLERMRCLVDHGTDDYVERFETPAFAAACPTVSVIVTLYNYAHLVVDTLDSIVASSEVDLEVVVIDDHSTDSGRSVVRSFMNENPSVPMLLLASDLNRGLSRSRNLAIEATRTDKVMIMDADNLVYPTCVQRLSRALDDDPLASFAYATLEAFGAESGLRSERGWYVPWLCEANYIDAQAMLRRSTWERHGGYDHDMILGWEDWDLWLRLAQAGEHGVHVSQMLGRYRTQDSSMISTTNLFATDLRTGLVRRYPTLPWPERTDS
jgi:glycosyltransferase involved in cell wall biosynthesis